MFMKDTSNGNALRSQIQFGVDFKTYTHLDLGLVS